MNEQLKQASGTMTWFMLLIVAFCTNYVVCCDHGLCVHPNDLSMSIDDHKNLSVYLKHPLNYSLTINFKYKPDDIVEKFPVNTTFEEGYVGPIKFIIKPKTAAQGVVSVETNEDIDTSNAFIRLKISKIKALDLVSTIIGWLYFVAWSISFYPQIYLNWKRKSVVGLDFNFLSLNIVGFFCYGVYNIAMYSSPIVQDEYFAKHQYGINPVHINDIVFAVHAFVISVLTGVQCLIYERGGQKILMIFRVILVAIGIFLVISVILGFTKVIDFLLVLDFFSGVKLGITIIKYIPQAAFNCIRKSTVGWSIGNVLLDFTGGSLSMLQMFLDAYNYNSWGILFGDFTKFGLGLFSVLFDILFIVQHYCLFRNSGNKNYESMESESTNYTDSVKELEQPPPPYGTTEDKSLIIS